MKQNIVIQNLKCGGCKETIVKHLEKIYGVRSVIVDKNTSTVTLNLDISFNEIEEFVFAKLIKLGYPPVGEGNSILQKSKSYLSCALGKSHKLLKA